MRATVGRYPAPLLLAAALACAEPPARRLPAPPAPIAPASPVLPPWSCPPGWAQVPVSIDALTALEACTPPPQLDCPAGEAQFLGQLGCDPIGMPCPAEEFADEAVIRTLAVGAGGPIVYARPGAADGDGSRALPYGTLAAALAAVPPAGIVALGKGTFNERLLPSTSLAVVGACVAETVISPSDLGTDVGAVDVAEGQSWLRLASLRVGGAGVAVWVKGPGARVHLVGVELRGAAGAGLLFADGTGGGSLSRVVIGDVTPVDEELPGYGLVLGVGAELTANRLSIERTATVGFGAVGDDTTATLVNLIVRDTAPEATSLLGGAGLEVDDGATALVQRVLLERNRTAGLLAIGGGARVTGEHVVIRDHRSEAASGELGVGVLVQDAAGVALRFARLERNRAAGAVAIDAGTELEITDAVISGTLSDEARGDLGLAVGAQHGPLVRVNRALLTGNRHLGLGAVGPGSDLEAIDVVVHDTLSQASDLRHGVGVVAEDGARVTVLRGRIIGNREVGAWATNLPDAPNAAPATLLLDDVEIDRTRPAECAALSTGGPLDCADVPGQGFGTGLAVHHSGTIVVRRFRVGDSAQCGLQVVGAGTFTASDGLVERNPIGLNVQAPAFDLATSIAASVRFVANQSRLDATALPLPTPPGM